VFFYFFFFFLISATIDLKKICVEIISVLSNNGDTLINDFIFNWIFNILNINKPNSNLMKEQENDKKLWVLLSIEKVHIIELYKFIFLKILII